ncbi:MAG TPA: TetR family transcriptional regulator C-terminal domain-containing protein [Burkholderiaceae bacterium]|nr:TetR family transcriptional regulator C-terminal domain-containing protein [Burkholderiaceae bacterium]
MAAPAEPTEQIEAPRRPRGRPRKVLGDDNERSATRERLIRIGLEVLSETGWDATGIARVLQAAEVPKGSFYHYFASKDDFGLAVVAAYEAYFSERLARSFGNSELSVSQQLAAFIDAGRRGLIKHAFRRGCIVGNLGQELGGVNPAFRAALSGVFERWEAALAGALAAAQQAGALSPALDPAAAARFFWMGWEGAVLRAKLAASVQPIDDFETGYLQYLNLPPATHGEQRADLPSTSPSE